MGLAWKRLGVTWTYSGGFRFGLGVKRDSWSERQVNVLSLSFLVFFSTASLSASVYDRVPGELCADPLGVTGAHPSPVTWSPGWDEQKRCWPFSTCCFFPLFYFPPFLKKTLTEPPLSPVALGAVPTLPICLGREKWSLALPRAGCCCRSR